MPQRENIEQVRFGGIQTNDYQDKMVNVYRIGDNKFLGQIVKDHTWSAWAMEERLCEYLQDPKARQLKGTIQKDMSFRRLRDAKAHVRKEIGYPPSS